MKAKPFVSLVILVITISILNPLSQVTYINAQDNDCDPLLVKEWLVQRQAYINATEDVLNAQNMSIPDAQTYLHNHLQAIEDLPRPTCATDTMLMTYYFYNQVQHLLVCAQQNDGDCISDMQGRVAQYRSNIATVLNPLASLSGFETAAYTQIRPEGWTLSSSTIESQPTQSSTAAISVASGTRTDPIALGQFYEFSSGKVRLVSVTDPYIPQEWYPNAENTHVAALQIEYVCEIQNPDESCTSYDVIASAVVFPDGKIYDDVITFVMNDTTQLYGQETFGGNTLTGTIFIEVPNNSTYQTIRFLVGYQEIYFSPQ